MVNKEQAVWTRYHSWLIGKAQCWVFSWNIDKQHGFSLQVLGLRENMYAKGLITWWWQDFGITGDGQGEVLGQTTTCSNSHWNFLFTYFSSGTDDMCIPIFDNGEFGSCCISCSTSLLRGISLVSWNTSMHVYEMLSNWHFCSLIRPSINEFTLTNSHSH